MLGTKETFFFFYIQVTLSFIFKNPLIELRLKYKLSCGWGLLAKLQASRTEILICTYLVRQVFVL